MKLDFFINGIGYVFRKEDPSTRSNQLGWFALGQESSVL